LFLILNKKKIFFNYDLSIKKTCCNLKGYGYKLNYDNVIDSYKKPIITRSLDSQDWYKKKSSDHVMILSILENLT
jgi:hypothetical protein